MSERTFSKTRRVALAGGAAVLLGSAAAGVVTDQQHQLVITEPDADVLFYAAGEQISFKAHREAWLKAVAAKLGVTPERLDQAMTDAANEQGMPGTPGFPVLPMGPLALAQPAAGAEVFSVKIDPGIAAAARALGMTEDQLRMEWPAKSLDEIAKARNVDPKVVADALEAQRRADLDKAVADKKLSPEAAERFKSHLDMDIEMMLRRGFKASTGPHMIVERAVLKD